MVMPYHLHMPSYFLETFTEYPEKEISSRWKNPYIFPPFLFHPFRTPITVLQL